VVYQFFKQRRFINGTLIQAQVVPSFLLFCWCEFSKRPWNRKNYNWIP